MIYSGWKAVLAKIFLCGCISRAMAGDLSISGANDISDNLFMAYGFNPVTQLVTGYLVALRTSPGRTDECRFVFAGNLKSANKFSVKYLSEIDGFEKSGSMSPAVVNNVDGDLYMNVRKNRREGIVSGYCHLSMSRELKEMQVIWLFLSEN